MRWTVMTLGISIASLALGCTGSDAEPTGGGNGNPATAVPRFVSPVVTGPALTAKPGVGAWFYQKAGEATSVLSIKNVSAAGETVTVPFRNTNGALLASPARALATGET